MPLLHRRCDERLLRAVVAAHPGDAPAAVDGTGFLEQPKDDTATIPTISFELLDKDGQRVKPTTQPTSYMAGNDIITAVALAEEGQELIFPLSNSTATYLTDKMDKMRLVVSIDGVEQTLEYRLKK